MYRIERIVVKAPHIEYVTSELTVNTVEQDIVLDALDLDTLVKLYRGFKYDYITCVRGTLQLAQDANVAAIDMLLGLIVGPAVGPEIVIPVVDDLLSTSATSALSANQGRMLDAAISNKLDASLYNEYYKGVYSTSGALDIAHPTAISGSYAMVDTGIGSNAELYWYDVQDGWVTGGGATLSNTDALLEGSANKYFTEARVRSTILSELTTATNIPITSSDSVLDGMGKLQAQINVLLLPTVNTYSATTSYTLQTVDNDGRTYLRMDNAASNTVTVPSTQTKPISIRQAGTGTTTLQAGSGVTLNGTLAFTAQHQTKTIVPLGGGIYDVVG